MCSHSMAEQPPIKAIKVKKNPNLYLSSDTLDLMEICDRAPPGNEYRQFQNQVSSMAKRDNLRTNLDKFRKSHNDPKVLWGLANAALGKPLNASLATSLLVSGIAMVAQAVKGMANSCLSDSSADPLQMREDHEVELEVNGNSVKVPVQTLDPQISLARFLRDHLHLTGTKISCAQGGCGACIVTVRVPNGAKMGVNACLTPLMSCHGWKITTVEGLGSTKVGLHPVQERLASFHGTQCGFCSPGMVMAMNSLRESQETEPTMDAIEGALDGNICRCTGYRPILDAFKSFAGDAPAELKAKITDIEDMGPNETGKKCQKSGLDCLSTCTRDQVTSCFSLTQDIQWMVPKSAADLLTMLKSIPSEKRFKLVAGNTGTGIYPDQERIDVFVDINHIKIDQVSSQSPLTIGAGITITRFIAVLSDLGRTNPKNTFGLEMAKHLKKVANSSVRNRGTLAGNLMLKHAHPAFPSDVFVLLEGIGAKLIVTDVNGSTAKHSLYEWTKVSMDKKLLNSIEFPNMDENMVFRTFKIAPRSQNAHAYVSAAFLAKINPDSLEVEDVPRMTFAGISPTFNRATRTETLMKGKLLSNQGTLDGIMASLDQEIQPNQEPVDSSAQYRKHLAKALTYKFILSILGNRTDVQFQMANCEVDKVDPAEALALPGVEAYLDHTDIPGENNWSMGRFPDEIFSSKLIHFAGQAIGLVVAVSPELALKAAGKVKVSYKNKKKPILTFDDAIKKEKSLTQDHSLVGEGHHVGPDDAFDMAAEDDPNAKHIAGKFEIGSQYHFHLETQTCAVRPIEEGQFEVYSSTQWISVTQSAIAKALGVSLNALDMKVRRLGGAYGGKINKCNLAATACAIAAHKLNVPVKVVLDIQTNMAMIGKRLPYYADYKGVVTMDGKLKAVAVKLYCDCGDNFNSPTVETARSFFQNCYHSENWRVIPNAVVTNTPSNTYARAPGSTQGHAIMEMVMEHAATAIGMDPLEFRIKNLLKKGDRILTGGHFEKDSNPAASLIEQVKNSSKYQERRTVIQEFNQSNHWKKRGMALVPVRYRHNYFGTKYHVHISIYAGDGTVAVSHGGIEMGQGINTKVAQVVARELDIPVDLIKVKPTCNLIAPNNSVTGGSMGSECCASAAELACKELKERMKKVKDSLPANPKWLALVKACNQKAIDLTARHMGHPDNDGIQGYDIWAAVVTEVEIDVLTGELNIKRADLVEDTGMSISPEIDIGQVEGGFVMGLGLWTTEELKRDPTTGELVTNDTWEYKPPSSRDIPEDLRTTFYNSKNNPYGVLGSKATGEPSVLMGVGVIFAIRDAINSAKSDQGLDLTTWYRMAVAKSLCSEPKIKSQHGGATRDLLLEESPITFTLNGKTIIVNTDLVSPKTSLARFIRDHQNLKGTKISCNQAGCGACVVKAVIPNANDGSARTRSVNSCITPVYKCDGWAVTTVEALGNTQVGLNEVQTRLARLNGTQCGYCTPGMVMAMDSFIEGNPGANMKQMQNALDGNICRCTGYRPIWDTLHSFASDAPPELRARIKDIEELVVPRRGASLCPRTQAPCQDHCAPIPRDIIQFIRADEGDWIKPHTLEDLLGVLADIQPNEAYRLVAGNTGTGIYDDGPYGTYVDITGIPELSTITTNPFNVGGGVALTEMIVALKSQANNSPGYAYAKQVAQHLMKVANTNVRNVGTVGGNLMLKHAHPDFPSDIFVLLEASGGFIGVKSPDGVLHTYPPSEWLSLDMRKKFIYFVHFPPHAENQVFMSYKITPRSQNAHAYVNAAFRATLEPGTYLIQGQPSLVYGGISSTFVHATALEVMLEGQSINDQATLNSALEQLNTEVVPEENPVLASSAYRKHLTQALFYKFALHALGADADPTLQSAATQLDRGVSHGTQEFETNPDNYPVGEPVEKLEAKVQCTGEAEYVDDIPPIPGELFAAFVKSTIGNCTLDTVDPGPALAMPGVVGYVDHTDIPGLNSTDGLEETDVIFTPGSVSYAGQAIGLIVADSYEHAREAAQKVMITYKDQQKPILTIREALETKSGVTRQSVKSICSAKKSNKAKKVTEVTGELEIGGQFHFHLELQSCVVRPIENGEFEIYSTTQWMDMVQFTVAKALNISKNQINVRVGSIIRSKEDLSALHSAVFQVRRLGGAYGGKIVLPNAIATACAVAARKVQRPVRLTLDLQNNMELLGKRSPYLFKYTASVDEGNKLQDIQCYMYADVGFSGLAPDAVFVPAWFQNCYNASSWTCNPVEVQTNLATNTACRAPSSTQGIAAIEYIMDHIADNMGIDPLEFRLNNLLTPGDVVLSGEEPFEGPNQIPNMVEKLKTSCDYDARLVEIQAYNEANKWKKRKMKILPMRWPHIYGGSKYKFQAAIFKDDGTVAISHGGIEMGQGINTKVAQVTAKELGIPLSQIRVKPSNEFVGNNSIVTGGSLGSELVSSAAMIACRKLRAEMKKVEDTLEGDPTWLQLVTACDLAGMDLTARHSNWEPADGLKSYDIWGTICTEIEMDILTGEKTIRRADIVEETGSSISPFVDVGQVEGAFVMGLGLWFSEELKYNPNSGRLLTRDTWDYKPPASQDIPEVFNVYLYNNQGNPNGVLGSKATGEPPLLMAVSSLLAVKDAIKDVRKRLNVEPQGWFSLICLIIRDIFNSHAILDGP
eukprot:maker-scaffold88_size394946-snap-gene-2.26 protein:Tk05797 transcript:maker-scaffold88_size394946-snap-gene-2.26-mRNA-1 annotation:"hypothetical protein DAPPUDRAFT_313254"